MVAPGASGCIDALLHNICNPGDGILIPRLYWNGFDFGLRARASVIPVLAPLPSFRAHFDARGLIEGLEAAIPSAPCPIKALVLTNPHNPLGCCYPRSVLEDRLRFCKQHGIHFAMQQIPSLSAVFNTRLLTSSKLSSLIRLYSERRSRSYRLLAALLEECEIASLYSERRSRSYRLLAALLEECEITSFPCAAGLYVFAKLAKSATCWEDEEYMVQKLKDVGVVVSPGRGYHGPGEEKGWARVGFAVEVPVLADAISRIRPILQRA
jgi:aspartate/methionine/tyrosine aminotransferase